MTVAGMVPMLLWSRLQILNRLSWRSSPPQKCTVALPRHPTALAPVFAERTVLHPMCDPRQRLP